MPQLPTIYFFHPRSRFMYKKEVSTRQHGEGIMYNRDHGKEWIKDLTKGARKIYKRAHSKTRRQQDKKEVKEN